MRPGSDALARLQAAQAALNAIEEERAAAVTERDAAVAEARAAGVGPGRIAATLQVDRQAVYRALRRHQEHSGT